MFAMIGYSTGTMHGQWEKLKVARINARISDRIGFLLVCVNALLIILLWKWVEH